MTDLVQAELQNLLPEPLKRDVDVIAIFYALRMAIAEVLKYSVNTRMYADIDHVSENILDYMAVEMRLAYYDESFSVEVKRELIKNSYMSYMEAGTKGAVARLAGQIFGFGSVVEWFDFTHGEQVPGLFDIETGAELTPDVYEQFAKTIENVKNESSHMRYVSFLRELEMKLAAGFGRSLASEQTVTNDVVIDNPDQALFMDQFYAVAEDSYFTSDEALDVPDYSQDENITRYAAMGIVQHSCQDIGGV